MHSRLLGIARNAFIETIRQPVYLVVLGVTAFLLIMNVALAAYTMDDDDKLLLDLGLSTQLLSGMFLAAFSAAGVLSREIESKTAMTVISKPVRRTTFIAGKYLGLLAALAVAFYINFTVFLMTQRHAVLQTSADPWDLPVIVFGFGGPLLVLLVAAFCNYFYDMEFTSLAIGLAVPVFTIAVLLIAFFDENFKLKTFWLGSEMPAGQVFAAAFLVFCGVLLLAAVALAASTRLGQVSTLLVCTVVFALGLTSDATLGRHADESAVASTLYKILPNLSLVGVTEALHADAVFVPWRYVWMTAGYCGLFVLAALLVGVALFQTREVG